MKKLFKQAKKGFTIVELVIVIGVIAILSAILIPTFVNLTEKANDAKLQSDLTNVYTDYYTKALEPEDLDEVPGPDYELYVCGRTDVFLSVTDNLEKAPSTNSEDVIYKCGADGKWFEYKADEADIKSVYKTGLPTDHEKARFNGYFVYCLSNAE